MSTVLPMPSESNLIPTLGVADPLPPPAIPAQWIQAASLLAIVGVQLAVLAILIGEIRSVRSDLGNQISNSDAQRQADTRAINARVDGAYRGP